jgi:hypothetical protein
MSDYESPDPPHHVAVAITTMYQRVMAKDIPAILAMLADDAVFFDPHYPEVTMRGKASIERGLTWAFQMDKPGFNIRKIWADDVSGVAEIDTHHIIRGRLETHFDQTVVFEFRDGLITRMQSYVPYRDHGIGGLVPRLIRLTWQLRGRRLNPTTVRVAR